MAVHCHQEDTIQTQNDTQLTAQILQMALCSDLVAKYREDEDGEEGDENGSSDFVFPLCVPPIGSCSLCMPWAFFVSQLAPASLYQWLLS